MLSEIGVRILPRVNLVVRRKADSSSAKKAIEVAVDEIIEETRKMEERHFALKL